MINCRHCRPKDNRYCVGKVWYSYADVQFCAHQIIWIIGLADVLREGQWPSNPDGSSYTDPGIRKGHSKAEAWFCKPEEILAEVEIRLAKTGRGGETLLREINRGITVIEMLSKPARNALFFISGWHREV